jgi:transcriptional regulator with XRE-family HTH domain
MQKNIKSQFDMIVINNIRKKRIELDMSQDNIAALLNLTRGFIGQIESPNYPAKYNLNHLNRLAFEMQCSPKDFLPETSVKETFWK